MEFGNRGCRPKISNGEGILAYADPRSIKDIRYFLGMVGFYRSFISHFSQIALPLTRLLKLNLVFCFGEEQRNAFNQLKDELVHRPILHHPDFSLPFIVQVDTSGFAIGAVLAQEFPKDYLPGFEQVALDPSLPFLLKGTRDYGSEDVFMPSFILPFQVHSRIFCSVEQYVFYVQAESHGLVDLAEEILQLSSEHDHPDLIFPLPEVKTHLKRLCLSVSAMCQKDGHYWPM